MTVAMPGAPPARHDAAALCRAVLGFQSHFGGDFFDEMLGVLDRGAFCQNIRRDVDGDDDVGAHRPRDIDRHGIDQRAVHQPAAAPPDRLEYARQRIGSAHRVDQRTLFQPNLMAGADLRRNRSEADRQILDIHAAERFFEPHAQPVAADQAAAVERNVHQAENAALGERAGKGFELLQAARGETSADDRTGRGADDNARRNAHRDQLLDRSDVRPAARGARAEHDPDRLPAAPGVASDYIFARLPRRIAKHRNA
jgi:hypothetical protein